MREDGAIQIFMNERLLFDTEQIPSDTTTSFSSVIVYFIYINKYLSRRSKSSECGRELLLKAVRIPPESNPNKKTRLW